MPEKFDRCIYMTTIDRREDYGDVSMPMCEKLDVWLDLYEGEEEPCK